LGCLQRSARVARHPSGGGGTAPVGGNAAWRRRVAARSAGDVGGRGAACIGRRRAFRCGPAGIDRGRPRREQRDWPGSFAATRRAHALAGWTESEAHGYVVSHDYFSSNIANWQGWFRDHIRAAPIACLEIGSWQGGSSCWLLDKVVGPRGGRLTCIDLFEGSSEHAGFLAAVTAELGGGLETLFDQNIARSGHAEAVRKLVGLSQGVLPRLHGERFDFIYIDGAHEAKFVIQDAVLCWQLLPVGGHMLFDDVPFTFPGRPAQDTARAINFFLSVFEDEIEVIANERQLLLRRRPS
jgi:predicted O-methyltransferase YrrM